MKSVTCILGSPRSNGNSAILANEFCESAQKAGAIVDKHQLSELNYRGCQNRFDCKTTSDRCTQDDDLTAVLEAVRAADIVVLASPIYFTDVTGQLKSCLDRWFSFFVPDYARAKHKSRLSGGKTLVFVQTQGEGEERYADILEKYSHSFGWLGFTEFHLIRAWGIREAGEVHRHPEVLARARELGAQLARQTVNLAAQDFNHV